MNEEIVEIDFLKDYYPDSENEISSPNFFEEIAILKKVVCCICDKSDLYNKYFGFWDFSQDERDNICQVIKELKLLVE